MRDPATVGLSSSHGLAKTDEMRREVNLPPNRRIRARDFMNDLQSGMTGAQLKAKYKLTSEDLSEVKKQLYTLKTKRTKHIVSRVLSGASPRSIMDEYNVKSPGLRRIFRTLLNSGALSKEELDEYSEMCQSRSAIKGVRRAPRKRIDFPLWIYDGGNPSKKGRVIDISLRGVRVQGIETSIAEEKTFIVRFGGSSQKRSFVFDAKCRWIKKEEQDLSKWVAGFEIMNISGPDSKKLQNLVFS
jgi:uncharacterized protein (DUF433 family)